MAETPAQFDRLDGWREPASLLALRWGSYRGRHLAGLLLLIGGGLLVQTSSAYTPYFLALGVSAHILGWWILPAPGWRRFWMAVPSTFVMILLLTGGVAPAALALPLAAWLYARQRPARSYPVLILPVLAGLLLGQTFPQYGFGAIVLSIAGVVLAGSAWIARFLASSRQIPSKHAIETR
ncbi:MAG: hypothetical protein ACYCZY_05645 [Lacisediminihabitans sp.]